MPHSYDGVKPGCLYLPAPLKPIHGPSRSPSEASDKGGPILNATILVDARGHCCPTPTLRLRRALEAAPRDADIVLLADDPLARIDVPHFLSSQGYAPAVILEVDGALQITVRKGRGGGSFGNVFASIP